METGCSKTMKANRAVLAEVDQVDEGGRMQVLQTGLAVLDVFVWKLSALYFEGVPIPVQA